MFKSEQNGVSGNLFMILQDYTGLDEQKEMVVLNGQVIIGQLYSRSPLCSILGPMYFFICINDLLTGWKPPNPNPHPPPSLCLIRGKIRFPKIKKKEKKEGGGKGGFSTMRGSLIFLLS